MTNTWRYSFHVNQQRKGMRGRIAERHQLSINAVDDLITGRSWPNVGGPINESLAALRKTRKRKEQ